MSSDTKIKTVVVREAIPAQEAVTKKVMELRVDAETKKTIESYNWKVVICILYYIVFFIVVTVFIFMSDGGHECTRYHHGECVDDYGLGLLMLGVIITAVVMAPTVVLAIGRGQTVDLLLKKHGWDGVTAYELIEVKKP